MRNEFWPSHSDAVAGPDARRRAARCAHAVDARRGLGPGQRARRRRRRRARRAGRGRGRGARRRAMRRSVDTGKIYRAPEGARWPALTNRCAIGARFPYRSIACRALSARSDCRLHPPGLPVRARPRLPALDSCLPAWLRTLALLARLALLALACTCLPADEGCMWGCFLVPARRPWRQPHMPLAPTRMTTIRAPDGGGRKFLRRVQRGSSGAHVEAEHRDRRASRARRTSRCAPAAPIRTVLGLASTTLPTSRQPSVSGQLDDGRDRTAARRRPAGSPRGG